MSKRISSFVVDSGKYGELSVAAKTLVALLGSYATHIDSTYLITSDEYIAELPASTTSDLLDALDELHKEIGIMYAIVGGRPSDRFVIALPGCVSEFVMAVGMLRGKPQEVAA